MGLLYCIVYILLLGILCFPFGRLLALHTFRTNRFPFRAYSFERKGKIYEHLRIRVWARKVPDVSKLVPSIVPPKRAPVRTDAFTIRQMVNETCIAEVTHVILCFAGIELMELWPGAGGVILFILYVILGNLPFILIQRYNRPRLLRLLAHTENEESQQR